MKVLTSKHYRLLGFNDIENDVLMRGWIFQEIHKEDKPRNYTPEILIVQSAKYVYEGHVHFLHKDGSIHGDVFQTVNNVAYEYEIE